MYLSQHTQPAQDVKVRRVRGALRVLAALGVVVAVVVFALFLLVAQLGPAPGASGAYQYAKLHATLYGKIAALSHVVDSFLSFLHRSLLAKLSSILLAIA
jgi:hypothetical protein